MARTKGAQTRTWIGPDKRLVLRLTEAILSNTNTSDTALARPVVIAEIKAAWAAKKSRENDLAIIKSVFRKRVAEGRLSRAKRVEVTNRLCNLIRQGPAYGWKGETLVATQETHVLRLKRKGEIAKRRSKVIAPEYREFWGSVNTESVVYERPVSLAVIPGPDSIRINVDGSDDGEDAP